MSDPIVFDTVTPRYKLPLLFAGQAQKEAFVNEAHAMTDALLHCAIEGTSATPPVTPVDGDWLFVAPRDGMRLLDRSTGQEKHYFASWQVPAAPAVPSGGTTVDAEARATIADLIVALRTAGIFPAS
jgi:hypothetical protein